MNMNELDKIVGIATLVLSIASRFIGFPDQIRKIKKTKNVESISLPFFGIAFVACVFWVVHGILIRDWVTIIGQGIGAFFCGVIVLLISKYRKQSNDDDKL